jgi:hypothetical protein
MKGNVFQRGQSFRIAEGHVVVANVARNSHPAVIADRGCKTWLDPFVENFKHAFACRASSLHKLIKLVQPPDRIVKKCREHKERDEIANLHCACQNGVTAKAKQEHRADRLKHRHRGAVDRPDSHDDKGGASQLIAYPIKARVFFLLANEAFDLTNPGKIVVQKRIHARSCPALQTIAAMRGQGVSERAGNEQRKGR